METMKRLIKKILRTICIWWMLAAFLINANALLEMSHTLSEVVIGNMEIGPFDDAEYRYSLQKRSLEQMPITIYPKRLETNVVGFFTSTLQPETFCKFSIGLTTTQFTETGEIIPDDYINIRIFSNEDIGELEYSDYTTVDIPVGTSTLPTDCYSMFYDATSEMLSCVIYIPQNFAEENPNLLTHSYILVSLGFPESTTLSGRVDVTSYTGIKVDGVYTQILNDISSKLDSMSGGGLTQEEINQAIQDALSAHDELLRNEGQSKLDELMEQLGSITEPYKQAVDQITGTLANVSNIFSYSGTDAVITLPAAVNPLAGNAVLWQAQQIDLGAAYNTLPSSLRTLLQYALRAAVLLAVLHEVINIIKYAIIGRGDRVD